MNGGLKLKALAGLLVASLFLFPSTNAVAPCVPGGISAGWNVFQTQSATHFDPDGASGPLPNMHFKGVPLVSHTFTGVGTYPTLEGDTVVRHTAGAVGTPITTTVEKLQLESVEMPGLFVTLSSDRGRHITDPPSSTVSSGTVIMTVPGPMGKFDSHLNVYFDIRVGSVNGPILPAQLLSLAGIPYFKEFHSPNVDFSNNGQEDRTFAEMDDYGDATHQVRGPIVHIDSVNQKLNGVDFSCDFHPGFL